MTRRTLAAAAAALATALPAAAQSAADSLPFAPGRWAVEGSLGGGGAVGAMRFLSRSTALTFNLGASRTTRRSCTLPWAPRVAA